MDGPAPWGNCGRVRSLRISNVAAWTLGTYRVETTDPLTPRDAQDNPCTKSTVARERVPSGGRDALSGQERTEARRLSEQANVVTQHPLMSTTETSFLTAKLEIPGGHSHLTAHFTLLASTR